MASGSNGGDIDPVEQYAPEEVATGQPTGSDAGFGVSIASQLLDDDFVGEERQAIVRAINITAQFAGPAGNPILQRLTGTHIEQLIDNAQKERVRRHDAAKSNRRYQFAYFVLGAGVTVGLAVFFTLSDNRDLIAPVVTAVAGFLGGLAAGRYWRS